ncbi:MATE family efflux transporter [Mailhella massiliensis]|uniref:MATE family efflux transporter n=1 Tax=Mailhella massiliensis TaxID=1903261 RepID=UPI00097CFCA7|nr:MATE family efflux transporter [Mailhella massiliensis]
MFRHFSKQETRNLVFLAIPVFLGQIAQIAMSFVDTVVAGRASPVDMAAVAVATSFWIPGIMFGQGLIMAITPLVAQALGAGNRMKSRHFLRQGLWLALAISVLLMSIFFAISATITIWGDMDPLLAKKTSEYLFAVLFGVPALMLFVVQRCFLEGHGRTRPAMVAGFIGLALNVPLNIIFVFGKFGLPAMGAAGCGLATAILFWFMAASMTFFVRHTDRAALAVEKPSAALLKRIARIGLPGAFAMLNETAAFALIALIVSPLGVTTVAGHQIAINVSAFVWMCPFSIGAASTIRVGTLLGAGDIGAAKRARLTALTITLFMACVLALLIYLVRYPVAELYTRDAAVIEMAGLLLICEVFYQFPDGIQTNTLCSLRGWNDTRAIFCISFIAYWVVSLPLGWILCMTDMLTEKPLGVLGFWIALIAGLSVAAVLYLWRIHRLEHLSVEAMKRKIGR